MYTRVRELPGIGSVEKADPTDSDLAAILESTGARVDPGDIHIRRARVAHDQYDRTFERFPREYLERFAETLPSKSVLPGHDTRALPLGRWYNADVVRHQEEFPCLVNEAKPKSADGERRATELVPGFAGKRMQVQWLKAGFYFANDPSNELFRKNLDTAVYQDVSIGFRFDDVRCDICQISYFRSCPHYCGMELDDGRVVTLTYSGDPQKAEARETSIVYLGAQQGAELEKSLRSGNADPELYSRVYVDGHSDEDLVRLKYAEAMARKFGCKQKTWVFPELDAKKTSVKETETGADASAEGGTMDLKEIRKLLGLGDDTPEAEVLKEAEKRLGGIAGVLKATEAGDLAKLQVQAEAGKKAIDDLVGSILAHDLRLTGKESAELVDLVKLHAANGNFARLKEINDEKFKQVCEKFPTNPTGTVETEKSATDEEKEEKTTPAVRPWDSHYQYGVI